MHLYKNLSLHSGVTHYSTGKDFIEVKFKDKPAIYIYSYSANGKEHIEEMKRLATEGLGLSTYINQHPEVRSRYNKR